MAGKARFSRGMFEFLADLALNNNREWFQANKARYEAEVRDPLVEFVSDFAERAGEISPHIKADPKPVGGSIFRIYRNLRFSKDKTPYKTAAAAHFQHVSGKDVHAPGFYLHLEPGNVLSGGGIWHPDPPSLKRIRDAIVTHPDEWRAITTNKKLLKDHTVEGDALKRPPKGYDADHPMIEDIKKKDHSTTRYYTEDEVLSEDFVDTYVASCKTESPYIEFIANALGVPW